MKCPYCGKDLSDVDCYDFYDNGKEVLYFYNGDCYPCNKRFRWTAHYVFAYNTDFEEDNED